MATSIQGPGHGYGYMYRVLVPGVTGSWVLVPGVTGYPAMYWIGPCNLVYSWYLLVPCIPGTSLDTSRDIPYI